MSVPINCKTLLGHGGLDFSITCLKSFIQKSEQIIHLQIFEDGTLTSVDKERLLHDLPNSIIVEKSIRDKIVADKLLKYPNCLYYRNSTGYAQKLFDIMLYDDSSTFYIDSDIFFIRKFSLPQFGQIPVFMSDTFNAYSFQPKEFFNIEFPIFPYINSGFFYFPKEFYNLDYIEILLCDKNIRRGITEKIPWLEQTIWAFLVAKSKNMYYFDNQQIMMAQQIMKIPVVENITSDSIAVHLVGSLRGHVFPPLEKFKPIYSDTSKFIEVRLSSSTGYLSKSSFFIDRLRKKWRQMRPNNKYAQYRANWTID